jgi:predicted phage tail protein
VIADPTSWREFWAQTAPFSLLEFARIGGKETLIPAVPYDPLYRISRAIQISALFNQGNILEDSYKEEFLDYGDNTQDLIATIVYRNTADDNVFPQNTSLQIMRADAIEADSIRQTFDLSTFVSSREQAIKYGKLLCQQRRFSRRAIEFKTFPTESPVAPGSYIYVQLGKDQWDDIRSGVIEEGGKLNIPLVEDAINGSYTILLYNGQDSPTKLSSVSIADNQSSALINYEGWLFVLGIPSEVKRVFRVTDVSMEEEGEITISAIEHPCEEVGGATLSKIANFDDAFLID